jgi:predicted nucleic acid-binding protein
MLLDTSGLLAYLAEHDAAHADAVKLYSAASYHLLHSYVLAELVAVCQARRVNRRQSLQFQSDLVDLAGTDIDIVWVDEPLHVAGLTLLQQRLDKTYSLCDAVSFVIMREKGIVEALTTDHHFEQEGLVRLLKP